MSIRSTARGMAKRIPGANSTYQRVLMRRRGGAFDADSLSQQTQLVLVNQYREAVSQHRVPFTNIRDAGFRCYSQFEEDGIILYVLSTIGMSTRSVVEIGCGAGFENMSSNLIINHGYSAYLFDGSRATLNIANDFYQSKQDCRHAEIVTQHAWITVDNVNQLLAGVGVSGEVDLLSIDIDGNDYHIWEAIEQIRPRLCVFETHDIIPSELSLTVPYNERLDAMTATGDRQDFRSASLLAMSRLSARKGYRLIGAHRHGFNAFFLRNDLAVDLFPEVPIAPIHDNPWTRRGQQERWPRVRDLPWVEV